MEVDAGSLEVTNNKAESRFEVQIEGHLAVVDYFLSGESIIFTHTGVPDALGGQGVGSKLAKTALEYAQEEELWVVPKCPFVRAYIKRHSEYRSLVPPDFDYMF